MGYKKEFEKGLNELLQYHRGNFLRILEGLHRKKTSRKKRERKVQRLLELGIECMVRNRNIRKEFNQSAEKIKRLEIPKGNFQKRFDRFFQRAVRKIHNRKFIYIFWGSEKKCLYVGKSTTGTGRLRGYRRSIIFRGPQEQK